MKRTCLTSAFVLLVSLLVSAGTAQAQIKAGDVISIDFGPTAPATANWNQYTGGNTTVSNLVRLSDGTNTGVSVTGASIEGNNLAYLDGSAFGGSSDPTIFEDGIHSTGGGNDDIFITISGLDDSLTYNIFGGGLRPGSDFGADWTIAGETAEIDYITPGNLFAYFENVSTNGLGEILINLNDPSNGNAPANNRNVGLTELTITATPEPTSILLWCGIACVFGLVAWRRRKR